MPLGQTYNCIFNKTAGAREVKTNSTRARQNIPLERVSPGLLSFVHVAPLPFRKKKYRQTPNSEYLTKFDIFSPDNES